MYLNKNEILEIKNKYKNVLIYENFLLVNIPIDENLVFYFDKNIDESYSWCFTKKNKKNEELDMEKNLKLMESINYYKSLDKDEDNKILKFLDDYEKKFIRYDKLDDELFTFPEYDGNKDKLWIKLKDKYNVTTKRKIKIITWGDVFINDVPKECEKIFDASILRGSLTKKLRTEKQERELKELRKMRGINLKIQEEIRGADLFEMFMMDIVETVEKKNLNTIGIFCSRGHHRSVACAEMLVWIYHDRICKHLTIDY